MRFRIIIPILLIGTHLNLYSQTYSIQNGVKRIIFLGNSITYSGAYINYIDLYFSLSHPDKNYEIINLGLPSETVSGLSETNHANGAFPRPVLSERLERLLTKTQPDLVFACYGMNDGIYLSLDDQRFKKFKIGIEQLHRAVKAIGSEIIHLTPPVYDGPKDNSYSEVLQIYSDWLLGKSSSSQWKVADIHHPMKRELEYQRLRDSNFTFAKDGVHPNEAGHFLIAKEILLYLGIKEYQGIENIDNFLSQHKNGEKIWKGVKERQKILKDAWLTEVGHKRPRMNKGLEMAETKRRISEINLKLQKLLKDL